MTTIQYQVPAPGGWVRLIVYNVRGQVVRVLVNEHKTAGYYAPIWNGINDRGERISSGVYFVRMVAPGYVKTKKLVLLK